MVLRPRPKRAKFKEGPESPHKWRAANKGWPGDNARSRAQALSPSQFGNGYLASEDEMETHAKAKMAGFGRVVKRKLEPLPALLLSCCASLPHCNGQAGVKGKQRWRVGRGGGGN